MMIKKCKNCGMLRAQKDMVLFEQGFHMCFSCWNKYIKEKRKKSKSDSV